MKRKYITEDDKKTTQIRGPYEDEDGESYFVAFGGPIWRTPWTY